MVTAVTAVTAATAQRLDLAPIEQEKAVVLLALHVDLAPLGHEHLLCVAQKVTGADGGIGGVRQRDGAVQDGVAVDVRRARINEPLLRQRVRVLQQPVLDVLLRLRVCDECNGCTGCNGCNDPRRTSPPEGDGERWGWARALAGTLPLLCRGCSVTRAVR